jgi:hypothetical protein
VKAFLLSLRYHESERNEDDVMENAQGQEMSVKTKSTLSKALTLNHWRLAWWRDRLQRCAASSH